MPSILELQNLKKYFATQKAVDDISLNVERGQIFGLLGPNGAGKTTLIRMITGIFYPDEGQIIFDGKKFDPVNDVGQIGYMPEERGLYKKMKIGEQAMYLAQLKGLSHKDAMAKINLGSCRTVVTNWSFCPIPFDRSSTFLFHQLSISNLMNHFLILAIASLWLNPFNCARYIACSPIFIFLYSPLSFYLYLYLYLSLGICRLIT